MTKSEIRQQIKEQKANLQAHELIAKSRLIFSQLKEFVDWSSIKATHIYLTIPKLHEVDTGALIEFLQKKHPSITIYAPLGKKEDRHYLLKGKEKEIVDPPENLDLAIVPLVAFDSRGYRIGNGGGYYDRFLKLYPDAQKIGLAFELQKVNRIPAEPHDVSLDTVITEERAYNFK